MPQLSAEQGRVAALALGGGSVYCHGKAGTGKSLLLRHIIRKLPERETMVTAPTGVAALLIGGTTLHSALGLGLGQGAPEDIVARLRADRRRAIQRLQTLVIDECSMLSCELFEKIARVLQLVRGTDAPFGGVRGIFFGDFAQLPPVFGGAGDSRLLFESPIFRDLTRGACVELRTIYRQSDAPLLSLLSDVRCGDLTPTSIAMLRALSRPLPDGEIVPTRLYCRNADVDRENLAQLNLLAGETVVFTATHKGQERDIEKLNKVALIPSTLELRMGAQVMLLVNMLDLGLCNGSRGVVTEVSEGRVRVRFVGRSGKSRDDGTDTETGTGLLIKRTTISLNDPDGAVLASRTQFPLKLAWATTIHKSQGQSLDLVDVHVADAFAPGQAYVALSRAVSMDGLRVSNYAPQSFKADPRVKRYYDEIASEDPFAEEESG
jgi:ATP-dependent DNA helicase PIF1